MAGAGLEPTMSCVGVAALGVRTARSGARDQPTLVSGPGVPMRLDLSLPATDLVDQHGARVTSYYGGTVMLVNSRGRLEWRIDGGWDRVGELLKRVR